MRLGVLDIGSNTGHLLIVDAHRGAAPLPAASTKQPLRLSEHIDDAGAVSTTGVRALIDFVAAARDLAADKGCESVHAFATSALREASNGEQVLHDVRERTGVSLEVLSGDDEAALTFLAVRRWFGWSSGQLLVLDIGGGSFEIAGGPDEAPDVVRSLPLGAARLTRDALPGPAARAEDVAQLRLQVRAEIAREAGAILRLGPIDHAVATSKTFRSLARICGAAPAAEGPRTRRTLNRHQLSELIPTLIGRTRQQIAELPGVSPNRAHQILAGAIVADAAMDLFELEELQLCPWALREGVILRRLDSL